MRKASAPSRSAAPLEVRHLLAAILGNALEAYDFIIYSFFAVQIGHAFFPEQTRIGSLMLSLATFGVGFVTRPIGAIVIGAYADRVGRRPAMQLSLLLMGMAIIAIALVPPYSAIGIVAPVLAVLSRLVQGFSLGGEIGSNTTFLLEVAPPLRRGFTVSWQGVGQLIALLFGSLVGMQLTATLSPAALGSYGWRIAFLIGALVLPVGLWLRNHLPETLHTAAADLSGQSAATVLPESRKTGPLDAARGHWKIIGLGFIIVCTGTVSSYINVYAVTYAQETLHLSAHAGFVAEMCNALLSIPAMLFGGWLSDRVGRRPVNVGGNLLFLLAIYPLFAGLVSAGTEQAFVCSMAVLGLVGCVNTGSFYAALGESLPQSIRVTGYGLIYSVGISAVGGTTQILTTWLIRITGSPMAPAWYLTAATAIGQIAFLLMPESAPGRVARLSRAASSPGVTPGK
jgi:MFS transporter, MHS family, citrate/tricarballylate:H+ symporter